jgi:hypothetical protein
MAFGALLVLASDLFVVDFFNASGKVENVGNAPAGSAQILVTIRGDRPYFPWPHSPKRNAVCLKSYVVLTDSNGRFDLRKFAWNSMFINKRMSLFAFAPGRMPELMDRDITSSIFAFPAHISMQLQPESARRLAYHGDPRDDFEKTRSETFASLQRLMQRDNSCGLSESTFFLSVIDRMRHIALSDEERSLTSAYCQGFKPENGSRRCDGALSRDTPEHESDEKPGTVRH